MIEVNKNELLDISNRPYINISGNDILTYLEYSSNLFVSNNDRSLIDTVEYSEYIKEHVIRVLVADYKQYIHKNRVQMTYILNIVLQKVYKYVLINKKYINNFAAYIRLVIYAAYNQMIIDKLNTNVLEPTLIISIEDVGEQRSLLYDDQTKKSLGVCSIYTIYENLEWSEKYDIYELVLFTYNTIRDLRYKNYFWILVKLLFDEDNLVLNFIDESSRIQLLSLTIYLKNNIIATYGNK